MTEPDEALLWAREELVKVWEQSNASRKDIAIRVPAIRAGDYDRYLHDDVYLRRSWLDGHRAGAAASAERIKELEARVTELEAANADLEDMASRYLIQMSDMLTRLEERHPEDFVWLKDGDEPTDEPRALLKEPDQ